MNGTEWVKTISTTKNVVVNETLNTTEVTTHTFRHIKYILTNDTQLINKIRNVAENKYVYRVNSHFYQWRIHLVKVWTRAPLLVQFSSFSHSFRENLAK